VPVATAAHPVVQRAHVRRLAAVVGADVVVTVDIVRHSRQRGGVGWRAAAAVLREWDAGHKVASRRREHALPVGGGRWGVVTSARLMI